jgi:hypothetical protein
MRFGCRSICRGVSSGHPIATHRPKIDGKFEPVQAKFSKIGAGGHENVEATAA